MIGTRMNFIKNKENYDNIKNNFKIIEENFYSICVKLNLF